jgi:hypothetical protein
MAKERDEAACGSSGVVRMCVVRMFLTNREAGEVKQCSGERQVFVPMSAGIT